MLLFLETSHAGVREYIRKLVSGDALCLSTFLDEFDGARYTVELSESGLVVGIKLSVPKDTIMSSGVQDVLKKSFPGLQVDVTGTDYIDFSVNIAPAASVDGELTVPTPPSKDSIENVAALRQICMYSFVSQCIAKFTKDKSVPIQRLQYRSEENMYIGSMKDNMFVSFSILVDDKADRLLTRTFLKEFEDAKKHEKTISSSVGMTFAHKKLPLELSSAPSGVIQENIEKSRVFFVTFVLFPKHIAPDKLQATTTQLINFRSNFFYHMACTKSYLHTKMRARVTSLLKVLNRAKTDTTGKSTTQLK
eukprot:PhF_6_TR26965/c0_g1_i1/m.39333/K05758/ARPC2; actin related protein 2/3 complex, subunit 2